MLSILQKADIHPARSRYSSRKQPIFILQEADIQKKAKGGRRNKLSIEDRLLMALEYIREYQTYFREYQTYFHVSQSYGVSESTAYYD